MAEQYPLKRYRTDHKLTRAALAKQLGVTTAAVSRWEVGKRSPQRKLWPKIVEVTGIPIGEILEATPQKDASE